MSYIYQLSSVLLGLSIGTWDSLLEIDLLRSDLPPAHQQPACTMPVEKDTFNGMDKVEIKNQQVW